MPQLNYSSAIAHAVLIIDHSSQPEKLTEFYEALGSGADLTYGDPRLALREWFITVQHKEFRGSSGAQRRLAASTLAWNGRLHGDMEFVQADLPMQRSYDRDLPGLREDHDLLGGTPPRASGTLGGRGQCATPGCI